MMLDAPILFVFKNEASSVFKQGVQSGTPKVEDPPAAYSFDSYLVPWYKKQVLDTVLFHC
jgi:hypothetical protein